MNDKHHFDDGMELIRFLEEGKMRSHPVIEQRVNRALKTGNFEPLLKFLENHPNFVAFAERNIQQEKAHLLTNPFLYPDRDDAREFLSGPLKLGYANLFNDMFGIDYNILTLPTIIMGRMGGGKSCLNQYLLLQILKRSRPFNVIIPDLKGNEYRQLLPYTKHLKVITKNRFKINLLKPPKGMTPEEYVVFFKKAFTKSNYLAVTSARIIEENILELYRKRGIFNGSQNWPTIYDLYRLLSYKEDKERLFHKREVYALVQNRLSSYIQSGKFDVIQGIPDEVWRNENVVLEMDKGFDDEMYVFMVSYLAGLRYHYNIDHGLIDSKLRTALFVDEGRTLNQPRNEKDWGESYITTLATRFRSPGIGLILSSHETASFSQTLRSTAYTKICFPLTDGADRSAVRDSFGLSQDQADHLFKLPRFGMGIVRYGGYKEPFLLGVPNIKLRKYVTDDEVERKMDGFYSDLDAHIKKQPVQKPLEIREGMPGNAAALLHFLGKNPFAKIKQMTEAPGFSSPAEVTKALSWLEDNGYVTKESYRVAKKGRKATFAVLNQKALDYLGLKGTAGKGSFEHKLYQNTIYQKLIKDGFGAKIEGRVKGSDKLIDVLAWSDTEGAIAYEISIHLENLVSNIRKNFESKVSKVVIVTIDTNSQRKAKAALGADPSLDQYRDRIGFSLISDFFP